MIGRGGGSDDRKGEEAVMIGRGGGSDDRKGKEAVMIGRGRRFSGKSGSCYFKNVGRRW